MSILDEILASLRTGNVKGVGAATTRNFFGPIQAIIPWASTYYTENGGPTLAGTWAYHTAQQWVTIFPLLAWAIRGVTRLQGWLAQALLGSPQPARQ